MIFLPWKATGQEGITDGMIIKCTKTNYIPAKHNNLRNSENEGYRCVISQEYWW